MVKLIVFFMISLGTCFAYEQDESKAVTEASREKGLRLSPIAQKNIGVKTQRLIFQGQFIIPKSSLVYSKDITGVYCLRNGWFKFAQVTILSKSENSLNVSSKELNPDEVVVVEGAALLRVSEMEAFSSEE